MIRRPPRHRLPLPMLRATIKELNFITFNFLQNAVQTDFSDTDNIKEDIIEFGILRTVAFLQMRRTLLGKVPSKYAGVMKSLFDGTSASKSNDILSKADKCIRQPGNTSLLRLLHSMPRGGLLLQKANCLLASLQCCQEFSNLATRRRPAGYKESERTQKQHGLDQH